MTRVFVQFDVIDPCENSNRYDCYKRRMWPFRYHTCYQGGACIIDLHNHFKMCKVRKYPQWIEEELNQFAFYLRYSMKQLMRSWAKISTSKIWKVKLSLKTKESKIHYDRFNTDQFMRKKFKKHMELWWISMSIATISDPQFKQYLFLTLFPTRFWWR